jgi:hypothetical protein
MSGLITNVVSVCFTCTFVIGLLIHNQKEKITAEIAVKYYPCESPCQMAYSESLQPLMSSRNQFIECRFSNLCLSLEADEIYFQHHSEKIKKILKTVFSVGTVLATSAASSLPSNPVPTSMLSFRFATPNNTQTPYYISSDIVLR